MKIKKIITKMLCASLILSNFAVVSANNVIVDESPINDTSDDAGWTTDESNLSDVEVTYQQSSSYSVTIPKTITLDSGKQAAYSVKVTGDIDTNQRVYVSPVDVISDTEEVDFYMKDQNGKKSDVVAVVSQNKIYWSSDEVTNGYEETDNSISAQGLTSGNWKGTFQVEIKLQTEQAHEHNYIDGVCDCGEIDPNHAHDFVNGTCTICNEQQAGLYDASGALIVNWEESGIDETCSNAKSVIDFTYPEPTKVVISDSVTSISKSAFNACTELKEIVIPDSVTSINAYAFNGCRSLTEINIPDSITSIGEFAFDQTLLKSIIIPDSMTSINAYAFFGCRALTEIKIPDSVKSIESSAFSNCTLLENIVIPDSVETIERHAFSDCTSLKNIVIPNSVMSIGISAFYNCTSLTNVEISDSVTSISDSAFENCKLLTGLEIPDSVTSIGMCAFSNCTSLENIVIPNSVTSIGIDAFYNVPHITYNGTASGSPWSAKSIN